MNIFNLLEQAHLIQSQLKQLKEAKRLMSILEDGIRNEQYRAADPLSNHQTKTSLYINVKVFDELRDLLGEI